MLNNAFELFFFPVFCIKVFQVSEGESLCCSAFFTFLFLHFFLKIENQGLF